MKTILILLLSLLPLCAMAQISVRSTNGVSVNQTLLNPYVEGYLPASEGATKTNTILVGTINGTEADATFRSVAISGETNWIVSGYTFSFSLFATNLIFLQTNAVTTAPVGLASGGWLWNSNQVIFWITSTKTNIISDGR